MRVREYLRKRAVAKPSRAPRRRRFLTGVAAGGALAYLLDPERGQRRRRLVVDRVVGATRRRARRGARASRAAFVRTRGRAEGVLHRFRPASKEPPDDVTLVHKVETIVFRDHRFPKGRISINAEQGEVFLRGELDRQELIHDLVEAVRRVPGVRRVENLLHLPGTPAPASHAGRHAASR